MNHFVDGLMSAAFMINTLRYFLKLIKVNGVCCFVAQEQDKLYTPEIFHIESCMIFLLSQAQTPDAIIKENMKQEFITKQDTLN